MRIIVFGCSILTFLVIPAIVGAVIMIDAPVDEGA